MDAEDKELLEAFREEVESLRSEMIPLVDQLKTDVSQSQLFETFGQLIDRIYGTAATMGFNEIAQYGRAMKEICYMCAQSDDELGRKRVIRLLAGCANNLKSLIEGMESTAEFGQIRAHLETEIEKVQALQESVFSDIERKTTA